MNLRVSTFTLLLGLGRFCGAFTAHAPFQAVFFVSSGKPDATASATFDHISIGKPKLAYKSSWIGNTYGQASTGTVTGCPRYW